MNVTTSTSEPTLTMTRVFDAPRELVFRAWTDPEQVAQWFAPRGFTVPRAVLDVRVGGTWQIDMQAPDGSVYPNKGTYLEIVPPEKIVYSDVVDDNEQAWGDTPPPSSTVTVLFEEEDGKTRLTAITRLQSIAVRDEWVEMGAVAGWGEMLDKLVEFLAAR